MKFSQRAPLILFVIVGLVAGCAPGRTRDEPAPGSSTVTSKDLQQNDLPIEVVLQKKVPGVLVKRSDDGGISIQIRGQTSFDGSDTAPLWILNGLPFMPGPGGALTGIDPYDIDTIKVLKGAEAGLYGIQGSNGVIVITTKAPGKSKSQ